MKSRAHIWVAIGVCVAFVHYHVFKTLILSAIGCDLSDDPCALSPIHDLLIDVMGFPLWQLPTEIFSSIPCVDRDSAEPLEVKAAINSMLWGLVAFCALQLATRKSADPE
jgi:hypothetical protein